MLWLLFGLLGLSSLPVSHGSLLDSVPPAPMPGMKISEKLSEAYKKAEKYLGGLKVENLMSPHGNGSYFNDIFVPPIPELSGDSFNDTIKRDYWMVEFFSPYCHHCQSLAPTWKTFYEYYSTLSFPAHHSLNGEANPARVNFTTYFNFNFARLNCVAFGTTCSNQNITSYPTVRLYHEGSIKEEIVGIAMLDDYSRTVEKYIKIIKPDIHRNEKIELPQTGDIYSPDHAAYKKYAEEKKEALEYLKTVYEEEIGSSDDSDFDFDGFGSGKHHDSDSIQFSFVLLNPEGKSVALTKDDFESKVVGSKFAWIVKFYTPWCSYCQALAPAWFGLARSMRDTLNVGEVNCDEEKALCSTFKVKSYPTIYTVKGNERLEYDGGRDLNSLTRYATKISRINDGVESLYSEELLLLEKSEPVIFIYFYDFAVTSEDVAIIEKLNLYTLGKARFVRTRDYRIFRRFKVFTAPRLMVLRDGLWSFYDKTSPKDMRNIDKIMEWIRSVWLPIVPEIDESNSSEILATDKPRLIVLGLLSKAKSSETGEFDKAIHDIKTAAIEWIKHDEYAAKLQLDNLRKVKQNRINRAKLAKDERALESALQIHVNLADSDRLSSAVRFAWIDSEKWAEWIGSTFYAGYLPPTRDNIVSMQQEDAPAIIIYDPWNFRFWDTSVKSSGRLTTNPRAVLDTLSAILSKTSGSTATPSPKYTASLPVRTIYKCRRYASRHPLIFFSFLFLLIFLLTTFRRRYLSSSFSLLRLGRHHHGYRSPYNSHSIFASSSPSSSSLLDNAEKSFNWRGSLLSSFHSNGGKRD